MPANAPSQCIFSCEWGKDRRDIPDGNMHRKIESFVNMAAELGSRSGRGGMVHGMRSLGSATLDLAYVAMGSFDIWWEGGCWEWLVFFPSKRVFLSLTDNFTGISLLVLPFSWRLVVL
jgi:myo-inositol-1(or 4)-monophosphatase